MYTYSEGNTSINLKKKYDLVAVVNAYRHIQSHLKQQNDLLKIWLFYLTHSVGAFWQSSWQRYLCHESHPMGGVSPSPLSKACPKDMIATRHSNTDSPMSVEQEIKTLQLINNLLINIVYITHLFTISFSFYLKCTISCISY